MTGPKSNTLLASLSCNSQQRLMREMTYVELPPRLFLYRAGETANDTFFLSSGLASVVSTTAGGHSAEVNMIGREGVVGALQLLGPATDSADCFMQAGGTGWRIRRTELSALCAELPDLRSRLFEFCRYYSCTLSTISCCNRLHDAGPRLARWLLMAQSRTNSTELPFTHDLLGIMLGSGRPTVSLCVKSLQQSGAVAASRGQLNILDRDYLRKLACECYRTIEGRFESLYGMEPIYVDTSTSAP